MLHYDFLWDLHENGLIFDKEINLTKLGWKAGDYFKLVYNNEIEAMQLVKVDAVQKFILKGTENGGN